MWTFPTLEPAVVDRGSFIVERMLDRLGRVEVGVGDVVTPDTVVARADTAEKVVTLFVASELGVPNDKLQRYLTKPVGSAFDAGEVVARARRGLRTATISAPQAGTLASIDAAAGSAQLIVSAASGTLRALVHGEVERVVPERGAVIRAAGARVFGILGFGGEAVGPLVVATDRADREVSADQVKDDWRARVVLTGMTVGAPALQRLRQAGVAGVIAGSVAEADIRRFLAADAGAEQHAASFWAAGAPGAPFAATGAAAPFAIVLTEGFGRVPMADAVFAFLRGQDGATVSLSTATAVGEALNRPEIYITSAGVEPDDLRVTDDLEPGRVVRLVGGTLGVTATVIEGPLERVDRDGMRDTIARVRRANGAELVVSTANIEVLV